MEELLNWIMENTYGQIIVSKYKWGGRYTAYSIKFQAVIFTRGMQISDYVKYVSLGNDMDLDTACKQAFIKLNDGYLNKMGGDIINGKIGARFKDGNEFTELKFGEFA
jgi:hypothetical protein